MGAEVFDDVAFYYVITSFVACCVIPTTLYIIWCEISNLLFGTSKQTQSSSTSDFKPTSDETTLGSNDKIIPDKTGVQVKDRKRFTDELLRSKNIITTETFAQRYMKKRYLALILGWMLFIYLLSLNSSMQSQSFVQFDPYAILEVDYGASDNEVRKAFRRQSMKWHPDKHTTDKEAAESRFLAINKAYQALTDPTTKANFERYGNPDGNQGQSITYGLPTWLSSKNNEVLVLIIYFLVFVTIPPALGYYYFRSNSDFHESGVMNATIGWYASILNENLTAKYLVEPLCIAMEFRSHFVTQSEEKIEAVKELFTRLKSTIATMKYHNIYYVILSSVTLQAYMKRIEIPPVLKDDLLFVLEKLPLLASTMIGIASQMRLISPVLGVIDVIQGVIQGVWFDDASPLLQLPYIEQKHVVILNKRGIKTVNDFRTQLKREQCISLLGVSEQQYEEMAGVAQVIPNVEASIHAHVPGYDDVRLGDILNVDVTLTRHQYVFTNDTKPIVVGKNALSVQTKKKLTKEEKQAKIENWELTTQPKQTVRSQAPFAVSNTFPHPKREIWYVILSIYEKGKERLLDIKTLKSFDDTAQVQFMLQVNPKTKGVYKYDVKVRCDSYIGCDVVRTIDVHVQDPSELRKAPAVNANATAAVTDETTTTTATTNNTTPAKGGKKGGKKQPTKATKKGEKQSLDSILEELDAEQAKGEPTDEKLDADHIIDDDEEDENEDEDDDDFSDDADAPQQEAPGKWYYLGASSFIEFLFNLALLSFIITLAYNELTKRGIWQVYIDPILMKVWDVIGPIIMQVHEQTSFITVPIMNALNSALMWFLGETTDMPIEIKLEKAMKSRGRMF